MRKWIIAIAALLTVPMVGAAAVVYTPAVEEQLVEGHTVFTVIQIRNASATAREEFAAAVAVLVRENRYIEDYQNRFPGVLWFNDQYLVEPEQAPVKRNAADYRYPCGAVIATNRGDPVPMDANGVWVVPANSSYQETYRITDPNDLAWDVDVWNYDPDGTLNPAPSFKIWSVATLGTSSTQYTSGDDGVSKTCAAQADAGCGGIKVLPFVDDTPQRPSGYPSSGPWLFDRAPVYHDEGGLPSQRSSSGGKTEPPVQDGEGRVYCAGTTHKSPGDNGLPYPCGYNCTNNPVMYNAVLFFFLKDLTINGTAKNHTDGSTDWQNDASACHPTNSSSYPPSYAPSTYTVSAWPCENNDDGREGNSHPYNPDQSWPLQLSEGRGNHGGSTGCGNNNGGFYGGGAYEMHATCEIDIYFGYKEGAFPVRSHPTVFDNEGKTAPHHCHDTTAVCNEEEHSATASWA